MHSFPEGAFAPDGRPWWTLDRWPGTNQRFGVECKLAAWLTFNKGVGEKFTIRELRDALGTPNGPNADEHFGRRMRTLRQYGWNLPSAKDVAGLDADQYMIAKLGSPIWLGKKNFTAPGVSAKTRSDVFARDGHRCVLCGVGSNEQYPGEPGSHARLTIGHVRAGSLAGMNDATNLRSECSRCNEPLRNEASSSQSIADLTPQISNLKREDKVRLLTWLENGQRSRDKVDGLYDSIRVLPAAQREEAKVSLRKAVK